LLLCTPLIPMSFRAPLVRYCAKTWRGTFSLAPHSGKHEEQGRKHKGGPCNVRPVTANDNGISRNEMDNTGSNRGEKNSSTAALNVRLKRLRFTVGNRCDTALSPIMKSRL